MHSITRAFALLLAAVLLAIAAPASAAESSRSPESVATSAQTDPKDAFLSLLLEKTQKYAAAGERAVEKAVDAVATEAPLALAEFLRWRAWMHGIKGTLPLVFLAVGLVLFVWQWGKWSTYRNSECLEKGTTGNVVATIAGAATSLISLIAFLAAGLPDLLSCVQILVAPRIYVIEQALGALK